MYNGKFILENVPSVGYLWGDYGSGAQIGKNFIREYFEGNLPSDLKKAFEKEGYNREEILHNVYKKNMPAGKRMGKTKGLSTGYRWIANAGMGA